MIALLKIFLKRYEQPFVVILFTVEILIIVNFDVRILPIFCE